jgi:hypothetical protein
VTKRWSGASIDENSSHCRAPLSLIQDRLRRILRSALAVNGMSVDPFFDPLEKLTYESIYETFRDVGSERLRLEFKETVDAEELARQAVAMANGDGGIVIVGFENPVEDRPLTPRAFSGEIDEPGRRSLMSKIQRRVYPSVPIDCGGYISNDGCHRLLLMRVEPSDVAPHERLNDRGRFIVRRGTETTGMTLRELEFLIRRRDSALPGSDPEADDYGPDITRTLGSRGMVVFDRGVPERFVGAIIHPEVPARDEPLSRTQQREIERIVNHLDCLNAAAPQTYTDGILFENDHTVPEGAIDVDQFALTRYTRVAYVGADGSAELRFQVNSNDYQTALIRTICTLYALGSQLFLVLGLGPRANGSIILHRGNPSNAEPHQPAGGEYRYYVDFATDSVEQMTRRPLMYALRSAGILTDPGEMDDKVSAYWQYAYSQLADLRVPWQ